MTNVGRALLAGVLILCLTVLLALGKVSEPGAFTLLGGVVGYVFGDRNGEKRLAGAVVQVAAQHGAEAAVVESVRSTVPPSAVAKLDQSDPAD